MVVPPVRSEVDVLTQGRSSRWTLPSAPSVPVAVRRLLVALLVLGAIAGWLVDQRVRDREAAALDACAAGAASSVAAALGPVRAMSEYVRPALARAPGDLRGSLFAMVGHEADGGPDLAAARATCGDVPVLAFHDDLRERRTSCEQLLQRTADYLARVALDGRAAFRTSPDTSGSAAACAG